LSAAKLVVPATNLLLASLPSKEHENFVAQSKLIELSSGEVLAEPGDVTSSVCFPIDCFISLICQVDNQSSMEIGTAGPEGMLGLNIVFGSKTTLLRAVVETSGTALSMPSDRFLQIYEKSNVLQQNLKNYTYIRLNQLCLTASCHRFHVLDARLSRWILTAQDCTRSSEINITHEFLAARLGVRRAGITKAAGILQKKKLISYRMGRLKILDRKGLEAITCGCYQAIKETYKKIMK